MAEFEKQGNWRPDGTSTGEMPKFLREKAGKDEKEEETQQEPRQQEAAANEGSEGVVTPRPETADQVVLLPIDQIRPNPKNCNTRSDSQIKDLARNIKRFGLMNAIRVRPLEGEDHDYEVESGEGRLLAHIHLSRHDKSEEWSVIKAIVVENDLDEATSSARRLSENRMRSSSWAGECIELARLKASGMQNKDLQEAFGLGKSSVAAIIAVGSTLERMGLDHKSTVQLTGTLNRQQFIDWVLPLRVPPKTTQARPGTRGFQRINPDDFDYAEVKSCLQLILSGDLPVEELEQYSLAHRPQDKPSKKSAPQSAEKEEESPKKKPNPQVVTYANQANDQEGSDTNVSGTDQEGSEQIGDAEGTADQGNEEASAADGNLEESARDSVDDPEGQPTGTEPDRAGNESSSNQVAAENAKKQKAKTKPKKKNLKRLEVIAGVTFVIHEKDNGFVLGIGRLPEDLRDDLIGRITSTIEEWKFEAAETLSGLVRSHNTHTICLEMGRREAIRASFFFCSSTPPLRLLWWLSFHESWKLPNSQYTTPE